ncbi:MAG: hypothetical protein EOP45_18510 [Sphingobacteriaceae bacterium]|nr:MAG: hypothetical protein EOP45_18510 [Sphingobacteriaceae bacterium]
MHEHPCILRQDFHQSEPLEVQCALHKVQEEKGSFKIDFAVFRHRHFKNGVIAQFFYVGAQVCISSFFIRYSKTAADIPEMEATRLLGYLLLPFLRIQW